MMAIRPTSTSGAIGPLKALTTSDRYIVNKIAANQAQIEVAYATAHALADLGRPDEARRQAEQARAPADTLLGDVRALALAQNNRSMARANELRREAGRRRSVLWLLFLASLSVGIGISVFTVRTVDRPAAAPDQRRRTASEPVT